MVRQTCPLRRSNCKSPIGSVSADALNGSGNDRLDMLANDLAGRAKQLCAVPVPDGPAYRPHCHSQLSPTRLPASRSPVSASSRSCGVRSTRTPTRLVPGSVPCRTPT